jgi:hypothetical protein
LCTSLIQMGAIAYKALKVVGVFVRFFRAPLLLS